MYIPAKFANFVYFCITRGKVLSDFEIIQNLQTSQDYIFRNFATKLHNFTKFGMLFSAVLMNIPNSKVCLKGEWSIKIMRTLTMLISPL